MQLHDKHKMDPHMMQLYWQGLQSICQDSPIDDQFESYPLPYQNLFRAQQDIGWDQLYYGHILVQWARQIDNFYTGSKYQA